MPERRPMAMPARRREQRMAEKDWDQMATTSQERMLGTAEDINSFLGPNLCCRNPPVTANMMVGRSWAVAMTASLRELSFSS